MGSRHVAAASVSSRTDAVAVAVSKSSTVRMLDDGELVAEIVPELWILGGYGSYLDGSTMGRENRRTTLYESRQYHIASEQYNTCELHFRAR